MGKRIGFVGLGGYSIFMSVDHFHSEGETVSASSFHSEPGGKGYNQAVAASRLGAECAFIGAFGRDYEAKLCLDYLKNEGIRAFPVYKDTATACACILTDREGGNRVTVYGGAAALLNASDICGLEAEIKNMSMIVLQNEVSPEANAAVCEMAGRYKIPLIINPAPPENFDADMLKKACVITPNEFEAKSIFGENWKKGMVESGITDAVVTMGADGALVYSHGEETLIPAEKVDAVDTTGAGDCFTAALAVKLSQGETLVKSAQFASKAASLAVGRRYAVAAMPLLYEVERIQIL